MLVVVRLYLVIGNFFGDLLRRLADAHETKIARLFTQTQVGGNFGFRDHGGLEQGVWQDLGREAPAHVPFPAGRGQSDPAQYVEIALSIEATVDLERRLLGDHRLQPTGRDDQALALAALPQQRLIDQTVQQLTPVRRLLEHRRIVVFAKLLADVLTPALPTLAEFALFDLFVADHSDMGVAAADQIVADAEEGQREQREEDDRQCEPAGGLVPNGLQHACRSGPAEKRVV